MSLQQVIHPSAPMLHLLWQGLSHQVHMLVLNELKGEHGLLQAGQGEGVYVELCSV